MRHLFSFIFGVVILTSVVCQTAELTKADELAVIAPFLNEQSLAIAHIDLSKINLIEWRKAVLDPLVMDLQEQIGIERIDAFQRLIDRVRSNSSGNAYVIVTMGSLPSFADAHRPEDAIGRMVFVVIPGVNESGIEALQVLIKDSRETCREMHHCAVIADKETVDQLQSIKASPRPELYQALQTAGNQPITIAIVPPPLFVRAAKEILLEPAPGTELPLGQLLSRGLHWASLGVNPSVEHFHARLMIQSADDQGAKDLVKPLQNATMLAQMAAIFAQGQAPEGGVRAPLLPQPKVQGSQIIWEINEQLATQVRELVLSSVKQMRADAHRATSTNNVRQILLALHNYLSAKKTFPDCAIRGKDGKSLLSWRVAILPYVEEGGLYNEFRLDEPWDSEHNRKLIERMPEAFKDPTLKRTPPGYTRYLALVGNDLAFPPEGPLRMKDLTDGTSKTIMIVEAAPERAVIWTKPDDLEVDLDHPERGLFHEGKFLAGFADGHTRVFEDRIDLKALRAMFTRNGGEIIDYEKLYPKK